MPRQSATMTLEDIASIISSVRVGGSVKWRKEHIKVDRVSDLNVDLGDITAGDMQFGQTMGRHMLIGETPKGLANYDTQNRPFWTTTYTGIYWRLGLADRYTITYDSTTGNAVVNGRCNQVASIPLDRLIGGPLTQSLFADETIETADGGYIDASFFGGKDGFGLARWRLDDGDIESAMAAEADNRILIGGAQAVIANIVRTEAYTDGTDAAMIFRTRYPTIDTNVDMPLVGLLNILYLSCLTTTLDPILELENAGKTKRATITAGGPLVIDDDTLVDNDTVGITTTMGGRSLRDTDFDVSADEVRIGTSAATPTAMIGVDATYLTLYGGMIRMKNFSGGHTDRSWPDEPTGLGANEFVLRFDPETKTLKYWNFTAWKTLATV